MALGGGDGLSPLLDNAGGDVAGLETGCCGDFPHALSLSPSEDPLTIELAVDLM